MRLFLDAHVSGRRIGSALRAHGHDVGAADEERDLDGAADEELLDLAAREGRILVTFNAKDFAPIAGAWGRESRRHAGCAIVVGMDHSEFGAIIRAIDAAVATRPSQDDWIDYTCFLSRPRREP